MPYLSKPQHKILAQVRQRPRVYDGRSAAAIKRLEALGLVTVLYGVVPAAGSHVLTVQRITVRTAER